MMLTLVLFDRDHLGHSRLQDANVPVSNVNHFTLSLPGRRAPVHEHPPIQETAERTS